MGEVASQRVVVIGAGRVATHLAPALLRAGHKLQQVWSRTEDSARQLAEPWGISYTSDLAAVVTDADVYIFCVSDSAFPEVAAQVVSRVGPVPLFLHTAGSVGIELWLHCGARRYGILYPLQTFSKERVVDFREVSLFLEASDEATMAAIEEVAHGLSGKVYRADSKRRARLHVAAVFACNFANAMYDAACRLLAEEDIPFEVMLPLIDETAAKVHVLAPHEAQTGPAVRGDSAVMKRHMDTLAADEELQAMYAMISNYINRNK